MKKIDFIKMHGLGNDFVILDFRLASINLQPQDISLIADRKRGVGCDQVVMMLPSQDDLADIFITIGIIGLVVFEILKKDKISNNA